MDNKLLLIKSITLLYRESQLTQKSENSADLIRTAVETITIPELTTGMNSEREILLALIIFVYEMCKNPIDHEYSKSSILQEIRSGCYEDEKLYEMMLLGIDEELQEAQLKRNIVNLRKQINNHFREKKIEEVLGKSSYNFSRNRDKIKDVNQFLMEVIAQLEPLQIQSTSKDPAIISDIDIGDEGSVREVFNEIKNNSNGSGIMQVGWQRMNTLLQGGIRRGEFIIIPALQHKYKSGFSLSLFAAIPLYNIPYMLDPTKKPLMLRISFEDDLVLNLQFLYQKLKYDETGITVNVKDTTVDEMSAYVKHRLQINGYHIKMLRIDPTQWSYKHICNKIIELEAQGYEIHVLMVDYIGLLPTTGCNTSGPMGTDIRDLIRRLRNFCSPKKITFMTPYQLSSDAKQLIRNGLPEDKFVRDVAEKGYYSGSKQLDQEVDLEIYIHLFKFNGETYLAVQRGKHRIPTIISEVEKYFLLRFPKKMPIPDDLGKEDSGFSKLPSAATNAEEGLFAF